MRKIVFIILIGCLIGLSFGLRYAWKSFPLISAYGAKIMCSCVFVAERTESSVNRQELDAFPINLGTFDVDRTGNKVTGSIFGTAQRIAIFRPGQGCTLLAGLDESTVRNQPYFVPNTPEWDQDTVSWPSGNKINVIIRSELRYQRIQELIDIEFEDPVKKSQLTHMILVVHGGELVAEGYGNDHEIHTKHTSWSMGKSVMASLIGLQVDKGMLSLDQTGIYPDWTDDRSQISLTHMLQATNGLDWVENYGGVSDATNMLFLKPDAAKVAASKPLKYKPGSVFYYSSGTTNILSKFLRNQLGDERYQKMPYEDFFYQIGMHNTIMEKDASGTFVGSSFIFAPGRDWARFGLLMLNKGNWEGKQILSEEWVNFVTTPTSVAPLGEYGAQWWLNAGEVDSPENKLIPKLPNDAFYAGGFEGQWVLVIPSEDLVIVRLGYTPKKEFSIEDFTLSVIEELPKNN
ncbi:serine hydrolase domain-containing protein [Lunatibacter salilacus]|uniref:serine hydrolase domain-containing protein n=1 Tax=Lunatibacter salilacus TaxID=2483804 RepID=UPI00131ABA20|nr:serine hydrolase [Lunatibacter salilacus]